MTDSIGGLAFNGQISWWSDDGDDNVDANMAPFAISSKPLNDILMWSPTNIDDRKSVSVCSNECEWYSGNDCAVLENLKPQMAR